MTDAEKLIWSRIRGRQIGGLKFVRQEPIGPYVTDFVCREEKLIIELDGGQHAENPSDKRRDAFLVSEGYRVLRFWNHDVMSNTDGVLESILLHSQQFAPHDSLYAPHPDPLPVNGEREESQP